eukprot:tig00000980_g6154.t1
MGCQASKDAAPHEEELNANDDPHRHKYIGYIPKVQRHGVLLTLAEPNFTVIQASSNAAELLGTDKLHQKPVANLFHRSSSGELQRLLGFEQQFVALKSTNDRIWTGMVHRNGPMVVLELEPFVNRPKEVADREEQLIKQCVQAIKGCQTEEEVCSTAIEVIGAINGYDRSVVYKFYDDGSGIVVAEKRNNPSIPSILYQKFPSSDFPSACKTIFWQNQLRYIYNAWEDPVVISPITNPVTRKVLDMTLASLRGTVQCHLEYVRRMGAKATMTLAIWCGMKLWGLVVCHHLGARLIHPSSRQNCLKTAQELGNGLIRWTPDAQANHVKETVGEGGFAHPMEGVDTEKLDGSLEPAANPPAAAAGN